MLGIIICDDDRFTLDISGRLAQEAIQKYSLDAGVVCSSVDFKEIINFLDKNDGTYLYFLDLDFGKSSLNGVDMAKIIKERKPLSKIVFVTSHAHMGMSILKSGVEAFGFIEKSMEPGQMLEGYRRYIMLAQEMKLGNEPGLAAAEKKVSLPVGIDEYISLPVSQILYVESVKTASHFVCYHTLDGSAISVRDTIENVLDTLGGGFVRSHRSVIINRKYVVAVSEGVVKFSNGETAACSFRLKNEIIKKCLKQE